MNDHIVLTVASAVAQIRINRPEKKNALTGAMYEGIIAALTAYESDATIKAVVIAGGADFTAGNDLRDFLALEDFTDAPAVRFLRALQAFPKPVIAAVRGVAVGIGTTMLLHTDVALAGASARFSLPFVKLGIVPEAASSVMLARVIGANRASRLLLTGETFDARAALEYGLISEVVEDAVLDETALALAARIAALPADAVRETKRLIRGPLAATIDEAMRTENASFAVCLASDDFRSAAQQLLQRA